jgi:D-alanyl-D-alanine carboxypeptidase/D-alanyl-D-alanine-endopeptidase (penicillin-binding protein 4)
MLIMKRIITLIVICLPFAANAQTTKEKIDSQVRKLVADTQMVNAILGFYVADANTGEVISDWNGKVGLAPASTQKIVTAVAAFDLLGKDYKYKTEIGYTGELDSEQLKGDLVIRGYGDPTFGSWRYESTKPAVIFEKFTGHLKRFRIKKITGDIILDASAFSFQPLPGGWIWDDIGNYYGAGTWGINWRENQYDLLLKPGTIEGDEVEILGTEPGLLSFNPRNNLRTGKKGSGDNAYIYFPPYSSSAFVEGTFEGGNKISGSFPDAPMQFAYETEQLLLSGGIEMDGRLEVLNTPSPKQPDIFFSYYSPSMDSIVYWLMKRSINLYGEALIKTIGLEKAGVGSTDTGVAVVRRFYKEKGIATPAELKIIDGSGLSPSNRITAESLVKILLYAKKQDWFPYFMQSFPQYNGMALKSGTIKGAKSFAGYHTAKDGKEYVVAIIVNNYDGTATSVVNKMYKVLDALK